MSLHSLPAHIMIMNLSEHVSLRYLVINIGMEATTLEGLRVLLVVF